MPATTDVRMRTSQSQITGKPETLKVQLHKQGVLGPNHNNYSLCRILMILVLGPLGKEHYRPESHARTPARSCYRMALEGRQKSNAKKHVCLNCMHRHACTHTYICLNNIYIHVCLHTYMDYIHTSRMLTILKSIYRCTCI